MASKKDSKRRREAGSHHTIRVWRSLSNLRCHRAPQLLYSRSRMYREEPVAAMRLTITTLSDELFSVDVSEDMELAGLQALCEFEAGIPASEMVVSHEGRPLMDGRISLRSYNIKEGDVLLIQHLMHSSQAAQPAPSTGELPESMADRDPEYLRQLLLSNPDQLALLQHSNPPLAEALLSGNAARFEQVLRQQQRDREERERQRIRIINADPFDLEAQRLIAEEIRQENVNSNMEAAMEYHPESFGQVVMLYVNCRVNGHPVKAFIDSGAQSTIMSQACAERCHIMRLVDQRWAGIAKGVGTQRIIGRVHLVQIQIGSDFLTSSFSILEEQPMDMLLGLDMLKRHQCNIDLKRNMLVIGTTGTETSFLTESELPECALQSSPSTSTRSTAQELEDRELAEAIARSAASADSVWCALTPLPFPLLFSFAPAVQAPAVQPSAAPAPAAPAPAAPVVPAPNPSVTVLASDKFKEQDVQSLTKMGFGRQQAIEELRKFNGDVTQASVALLAKSIKLPS